MTRKRKAGYWAKITKRKEMGGRKEIIKTNFVWKILQLSLILYKVIKVLKREQNKIKGRQGNKAKNSETSWWRTCLSKSFYLSHLEKLGNGEICTCFRIRNKTSPSSQG